jgi:hypothetical protein
MKTGEVYAADAGDAADSMQCQSMDARVQVATSGKKRNDPQFCGSRICMVDIGSFTTGLC